MAELSCASNAPPSVDGGAARRMFANSRGRKSQERSAVESCGGKQRGKDTINTEAELVSQRLGRA